MQQLKEVSKRHGERHWETIASELGVRRRSSVPSCLSFLPSSTRLSVLLSLISVCVTSLTSLSLMFLSHLSVSQRLVSLSSVSLHLSVSQTGRTAFLCLQTFQRFVSDSLRRGSWTPTEDTLLRELVDKMRIGNFIPYTQSNDITHCVITHCDITL